MATRKETTHAIIHCSRTPPDQDIGLLELDRKHRSRGLFKVGYHFIIRRNGTLEVGRPYNEIGAHCRAARMNLRSVGVCLIGGASKDGRVPEDNFAEEQLKTLYLLLRNQPSDLHVIGHRDVPGVSSTCPSFDVSEWMTEAFPNLGDNLGDLFHEYPPSTARRL